MNCRPLISVPSISKHRRPLRQRHLSLCRRLRNPGHQNALRLLAIPPSTVTIVPEVYPECVEARKAASAPISSSRPARPNGIAAIISGQRSASPDTHYRGTVSCDFKPGMRHIPDATKIILTNEERQALEALNRSGKTEASMAGGHRVATRSMLDGGELNAMIGDGRDRQSNRPRSS